MKKRVLTSVIAGVACCSSVTWAASNGEGQISFNGEILDTACEVVNNLSKPLQVDMGKIAKSAFTGVGVTADTTRFTIELKNCPAAVTAASVNFGGTPDSKNNTVLALTDETDAATGIGIQLLDATETPISLHSASVEYPLVASTSNKLQFGARYIETGSSVTAGPANGVSTFTIVYN